MRFSVVPLAFVLLSACVAPAPPPPPPPIAAPAPRPAPAVVAASGDWRDWPLTPGDWRYQPGEFGKSSARFGAAGAGFVFAVACDARTRTITLSTVGLPGPQAMTIRTSSTQRTLPTASMARADAWPPLTSDARLPANDPLLDAMGFSRGRFVVEQPGQTPLVIPAWAEILRVVEDCRG